MYRIFYPASILLLGIVSSMHFCTYTMEKSERSSPLECLVSIAENSYQQSEDEGVSIGHRSSGIKRKTLYHSCYIAPCPSVFSTRQALQNHVLACHLRLLLQCPAVCKGRRAYFAWPSRYKQHIQTKHKREATKLLRQRVLVKGCDSHVPDREIVMLYNLHANGECLLAVPGESAPEPGSPEILLSSHPQLMQEG